MAIPVPYSWVDKEIPDFRQMEARLADMMTWLMNPPFVRLRKTVTQSIATSTHTAVSWDFVEVETVNMWDSTAPTRIKPSVAGWYVGTCGFSFTGNSTGYREMNLAKNGTQGTLRVNADGYTLGAATNVSRGNIFLEQFNGTTDYLEMQLWQNTGAGLSVLVDIVERQPDFSLRWVAPL